MLVRDKVVVVTGAARGIGEALVRRFYAEGARAVVAADLDGEGAEKLAADTGGFGMRVDVGRESDIQRLVQKTLQRYGQIDLFCSNAGIFIPGGIDAPDADWLKMRDIHLLAHVYAARAVLPGMLARGEGYLLQTVSAAGLLTMLGSAPYSVTKHAALGLAEWLNITYGDRGIKVSALCSLGVKTRMLERAEFGGGTFLLEDAIEPDEVAEAAIKGLDAEQFLIAPHPKVLEYMRRKTSDYDRWLSGMRRLQATMTPLKAPMTPLKTKP